MCNGDLGVAYSIPKNLGGLLQLDLASGPYVEGKREKIVVPSGDG